MASPATTARTDPAGIKLWDGYSSVIAFALDPDISFWEKSLQPPGIDGGDAIEQTTMHNNDWRTMRARQLKTLTELTGTAAYDPAVFTQADTLVNQEGSITWHFPDGSTLDFFGYLKAFEFADVAEGEQPELTFTVVPTNYDPVNHVEAAPVLTSAEGT